MPLFTVVAMILFIVGVLNIIGSVSLLVWFRSRGADQVPRGRVGAWGCVVAGIVMVAIAALLQPPRRRGPSAAFSSPAPPWWF